jgi:hypothetical protein
LQSQTSQQANNLKKKKNQCSSSQKIIINVLVWEDYKFDDTIRNQIFCAGMHLMRRLGRLGQSLKLSNLFID